MTSPIGFRGTAAVPNLPTPPTGFAVAAYPTYASAQAAVEHLIKHDFSIQDVTIVGSDLQMVERVTGRLTAGKLAAAGAASGAWIGLFVGLLMFVFSPVQGGILLLILAVDRDRRRVRRGHGVPRLLGGQGPTGLHLGVAGGRPPVRRAVPAADRRAGPGSAVPDGARPARLTALSAWPQHATATGPAPERSPGRACSRADDCSADQARALALSWSNSAWLMVPLSSSAFASAM